MVCGFWLESYCWSRECDRWKPLKNPSNEQRFVHCGIGRMKYGLEHIRFCMNGCSACGMCFATRHFMYRGFHHWKVHCCRLARVLRFPRPRTVEEMCQYSNGSGVPCSCSWVSHYTCTNFSKQFVNGPQTIRQSAFSRESGRSH